MPFNSLKYFIFLPAVYLVFYLVGERARWFVLLAASLMFYAALNVPYLLVAVALVAIATYGFGIWLDQAVTVNTKRVLLWCGISANLLILIVMKYLSFISVNLNELSTLLSLDTRIQPVTAFVAIGVSYYVFQAISYLLDIYLEIEKPERHFGYFALYLAFFPKLLQGPIERAGDLLPQLKQPYQFNYDSMRSGMLLFTWGLFKKVAVADRLALYADKLFDNVHDYSGLALIFGTYAYALQIYFDFAGYTDMARGSGRMFGINLTENFKSPYLATSMVDFWRRWHISFSRWILDYIFKPLQMEWRKMGQIGSSLALLITFLVSGIWHGATWSFVIWGMLHGIYLVSSTYYRPYQKALYKWLGVEKSRWIKWWQIFVTFNLISFAWIFFRAKNLDDAWYVIGNLFNFNSNYELAQKIGTKITIVRYILLGNSKTDFICLLLALFASLYISFSKIDFYSKKTSFRWSCYYLLLFSVVIMGVTGVSSFVYYRF